MTPACVLPQRFMTGRHRHSNAILDNATHCMKSDIRLRLSQRSISLPCGPRASIKASSCAIMTTANIMRILQKSGRNRASLAGGLGCWDAEDFSIMTGAVRNRVVFLTEGMPGYVRDHIVLSVKSCHFFIVVFHRFFQYR